MTDIMVAGRRCDHIRYNGKQKQVDTYLVPFIDKVVSETYPLPLSVSRKL